MTSHAQLSFGDDLPLEWLQQIDQACDAFEAAWRGDDTPRIEGYLEKLPVGAHQEAAKQLLAVEFEQRVARGETLPREALVRRFPEFQPLIDDLIAAHDTGAFQQSEQSTADVSGPAPRDNPDDEPVPERIGRYTILAVLGTGGFGRVYRARDTDLGREVAIKGPSPRRWRQLQEALERQLDGQAAQRIIDEFLEEARKVAGLKHPGLVTVHDFRVEEGRPWIVQELIDGQNLRTWARQQRPDDWTLVRLMMQVAEVLRYAHQQHLVHRDLKPENILVDAAGRAYVMDFGLALHESVQLRHEGENAGTLAYMSPEQVRGEAHRLDGRSDLWSLGVIFYELLVGQRPFTGTLNEIVQRILNVDPRPLRMRRDTVAAELDRICRKLLEKRQSDRFPSAADLIEDLQAWLTPPALPADPAPSDTAPPVQASDRPVRIVPAGLRSFDASDADFFPELLPGLRDRDGLPDSVRFWKRRIEEFDPEQTFSVGLIYGPSGCGKSSFVKAGLLPRLAPTVVKVYVEATPDDTEVRILKEIRKRLPQTPENLSLAELLQQLRQRGVGAGRKLLIVIDQFEQWLHAHGTEQGSQLVEALRHCDGRHMQCIVMVRDDFWLAVTRFLTELEVEMLQGRNMALVDRFDLPHARSVLYRFGVAYGRLPESQSELNREQTRFLDRAVTGLSEDGKVISVRLSLLAEMMKGKRWTAGSLQRVGGATGIGVAFLEDTFSTSTAPPLHRLHQKAARGVLKALLPDAGTNIRGHMRSRQELLEASSCTDKPRDFHDLLRILDSELRLITPTDPEGQQSETDAGTTTGVVPGEKYYQLTHDYLVPSLRDWLNRKQRETRRGRAELRLEERSAAWNSKPENRYLPSLWEYLNIRTLTSTRHWTDSQRRMMAQATRVHGLRFALGTVAMIALVVIATVARANLTRQHEANRIRDLVSFLVSAEPNQLPNIVKELDANPNVADTYLLPLLTRPAGTPDDRRAQLHARLATVSRDPSLVARLAEELLTGHVTYVRPIRQLLHRASANLTERFRGDLSDTNAEPQRRFRAALALADDVPESQAASYTPQELKFVVEQLVSSNPEFQPLLREVLRPIQGRLLGDLERILTDPQATETHRLSAANAIADYWAGDVARSSQLLAVATPEQLTVLLPAASRTPATVDVLSEIAATLPAENLGSVERVRYGQRRANAAAALLRLGERAKFLSVFEMTDDPEAMTQFLFCCRQRGVGVEALLDCLGLVSAAAPDRYPRNSLYALLLALGEFSVDELPAGRRDGLLQRLTIWYATHPSSGVHGAVGWLLRQWGRAEDASKIDQTPIPYSPDREWFTLAVRLPPIPERNPPAQANAWRTVGPAIVSEIEAAQGFVAEKFAICQAMPLARFLQVCEDLRGTGYRPSRVRPYQEPHATGSDVLAAAVWTRDGAEWVIHADVTAQDILDRHTALAQPGMIAADVAGYRVDSPAGAADKFIGLWVSSHVEQRTELLVGVPDDQHEAAWMGLRDKRLSPATRQCFISESGELLHTQVWTNDSNVFAFWLGDEPFFFEKLRSAGQVLTDLCVFETSSALAGKYPWNRRRHAFVMNDSAGVEVRVLSRRPLSEQVSAGRRLESEGFRPVAISVGRLDNELQSTSVWHRSRPTKTFYYTFIVFPAGVYTIGSVADEPDRSADEVRHSVTLTQPFALLDREITNEELIAFHPSDAGFMSNPKSHPSDSGSVLHGYDSVAFCRWLGEMSGLPESEQPYAAPESLDKDKYPGEPDPSATRAPRDWPVDMDRRGFRLPTEVEWEAAARCGARTAFCFGGEQERLGLFGWAWENSGNHVHPTKQLRPNARGLFDVHGNLSEQTHSRSVDYDAHGEAGGPVPHGVSFWVGRGGGWSYSARSCRSALRNYEGPSDRNDFLGFRLALSPSGVSPEAGPEKQQGAKPASGGTEERRGAATTVP